MLLSVDDISLLYMEHATKAAIDVKPSLSVQYKLRNLGSSRQFLGITIHLEEIVTGTGISHGQMAFVTNILKRFNMQNADSVSTPMNPNVKNDLTENQGEQDLNDIKVFLAIVGSLMFAAHVTLLDMSFAVAALCRYNSCPVTSLRTTTRRVRQLLISTADFRLHFRNSTGSNNVLTGYRLRLGR
jgi:hypothetical protein